LKYLSVVGSYTPPQNNAAARLDKRKIVN